MRDAMRASGDGGSPVVHALKFLTVEALRLDLLQLPMLIPL